MGTRRALKRFPKRPMRRSATDTFLAERPFESGMRLHCFPPVIDRNTRIVILGSFPGIQSLKRKQYYANPQNQFWRLVGASIGEDLAHVAYNKRLALLRSHGIGLWDVHASCQREGSVDGNIRKPTKNYLKLLQLSCPCLARVCCNGKHAAAHAVIAGIEVTVLPSSSPANTMRYHEKLLVWRAALRMPN